MEGGEEVKCYCLEGDLRFKMFLKWHMALSLKMFMLRLAAALSGWCRSTKLCTSPHIAQISRIKEVGTSSLLWRYFLHFAAIIVFLWSHGVLFNNLYKKTQNTLKFKRRHSEFEWTKATQQLTLLPIGVTDSGYFPLDHSSMNTADAYTPSLLFHDSDSLRVCNSRHSMSSETLCVRKICS